ncbi:MAG: hypothetical protein DMF35_04595 [Verrucomicrobia bacterium]|nr:MAG: hypothetical protein DMF35_04595 [Verrucomicrobiota bacterium]
MPEQRTENPRVGGSIPPLAILPESAKNYRMPQPARLPRKPNLVFFLPDQQRADTLACCGNPRVHAPNLNRLAAESMVFSHAYVTQQVCAPSRASLLTGVWPHTSGCTNNGFAPDSRIRFLPQLLGDSDYRTAYIGKWHLGKPGPKARGFEEFVSVERVSDYSNFLIENGLKPDHESGGFSALTISNLPIELSQPKFVERHACDFIQRNARSPFLLVVSFVEPHSPYNSPFNDEHALEQIDVDPSATVPLSEDVPLRYRLTREWQQDRAARDGTGKIRRFNFGLTLEEYRDIRQRYFGLITFVDRSIGAILASVENAGLREDTIIVHTSDHGDLLGAHQLFGKGVMFEEAVRVPCMVRASGQPRARVISQPLSHIDFVPTLLELLGSPPAAQCAGKSRAALVRGETMPLENVFIEWSPYRKVDKRIKMDSSLAPREKVERAAKESTRAVITPDGWKLCLRDKDLNELYNLRDDPVEIRNLYNSAPHSVIAGCADQIWRWQESTSDKLDLSTNR